MEMSGMTLPKPFLKRFEYPDGSWKQLIWDEEREEWLPHSSSSDLSPPTSERKN